MLFKFKKIVGCIEPLVKYRDTNRIVSWCIVTALVLTLRFQKHLPIGQVQVMFDLPECDVHLPKLKSES